MELGDLAEPLPPPTPDQIENSLWNRVVKEIRRIEDEHRLVVILSHGFVDMMVNAMIAKTCRHQKQIVKDTRQWNHAAKLVLLNEMKVLTDHHYRLLKWFNTLRNEFAHQPLFVMKADRPSDLLRPDHRDLKTFGSLCIDLLKEIWLSYFPLIGDLFIEGVPVHADPRWKAKEQGLVPMVPTN